MAGLLALIIPLSWPGPARGAAPRVTLLRTPDGGIQPQAAVDSKGVLHLIYFKGDPAHGDLFYVRRAPGQTGFSAPIRVNSQAGSAIAVGTIRGGQIALGGGGRVHVAWNGSDRASPRGPNGGAPMLYTRMNDAGTAFEPERNLMQFTRNLDGGGTVAADGRGNVYVVWHAGDASTKDESGRRLWVARSADDGNAFAREAPATSLATGACGCCGARAYADRRARVYLLYRAATENTHRDMMLLASGAGGRQFKVERLHKWVLNYCPMSSESFAEGPNGVVAAWETKGQVYFARIGSRTLEASQPVAAPGPGGKRQHPSVAVSSQGQVLMAWTDGAGWERGGDLEWQLYSSDGRPIGEMGRLPGGIPVWGLPAVAAQPDGTFALIH